MMEGVVLINDTRELDRQVSEEVFDNKICDGRMEVIPNHDERDYRCGKCGRDWPANGRMIREDLTKDSMSNVDYSKILQEANRRGVSVYGHSLPWIHHERPIPLYSSDPAACSLVKQKLLGGSESTGGPGWTHIAIFGLTITACEKNGTWIKWRAYCNCDEPEHESLVGEGPTEYVAVCNLAIKCAKRGLLKEASK